MIGRDKKEARDIAGIPFPLAKGRLIEGDGKRSERLGWLPDKGCALRFTFFFNKLVSKTQN